jgi:CCR4-NOT transcription complex subunit 3
MVDELEQQVETLEAEGEAISQTVKKGKAHGAKAERMAEIERIIERHKWHQGKLELIRRSLENGAVEAEQVTDLEESIRYYVSDGMNDDFMEDEEMYNDLNLDNEEDAYGMNQEGEKGSSQDTQSIQEDVAPEPEPKPMPVPKARPAADPALSGGRRPSAQLKSPLPTLATLHAPLQSIGSNSVGGGMKPASLPPRPAEGLKYASAAAAAAAASEKGLGISPLPPPPSAASLNLGISPLPPAHARPGQTTSPAVTTAQPVATEVKQPTPQPSSSTEPTPSSARPPSISGPPPQAVKSESSKAAASRAVGGKPPTATGESESAKGWLFFITPSHRNSLLTSYSPKAEWRDKWRQAYTGRARGRVYISPAIRTARSR